MKKKFSNEEIDEILKSNPPVYSSGIYFSAMAKKFGLSDQAIKNKCVKLGLIKFKMQTRKKRADL